MKSTRFAVISISCFPFQASVRAMDTIASFAKSRNPKANVDKFMVVGESKRGWTTWTTAAVDKRVIAIAPIVMDLLNLVKNLHHHYRSLGGWTFAFKEYYEVNITASLDDPQIQEMAAIVDPFAYRDRLNMPKYIVTTSGDEFFLLDDSYYYFNDMVGETYLRVMPNAEHSLILHRESLFFGIRSFYLSVLNKLKRPKISWVRANNQTGGSITFTTDTKPDNIVVYHAMTTDGVRRDFRLLILDPNDPNKVLPHPVIWLKDDVEHVSENVYRASYSNPKVGWMGFFIQATFRLPGTEYEYEFTSQVQIIPNTLPFPDCHGAACRGKLV